MYDRGEHAMVSTQGAPATGVTVWQIDPAHSTVEFAVKHMMVTTVKGQFTGISGTITLDEADLARSSVAVEIDAASVTTRDPQRDGHLRSADFFDVANYPKLTFTSTRVEPLGPDRLRVTGDLTIRGVTRPVVLDVTYHGRGVTPFGTTIVAFSAETTISRADFGLTWNVALEAGGVLVSDAVKISIEVEAVRQ
jgi:polyisoprenoid-binding protein YceI